MSMYTQYTLLTLGIASFLLFFNFKTSGAIVQFYNSLTMLFHNTGS